MLIILPTNNIVLSHSFISLFLLYFNFSEQPSAQNHPMASHLNQIKANILAMRRGPYSAPQPQRDAHIGPLLQARGTPY